MKKNKIEFRRGNAGGGNQLRQPYLIKYIKDIITAPEEKIVPTMKWMTEKLNDNIEPSCAVPLAALLENKSFFKGNRIAIIISGGNISKI